MSKFTSPLDHLANHSCKRCQLADWNDRVCVMGDGDPTKKVMILGEAPGSNEARTGRVFSGAAGQVLDSALRAAGLDRGEVYVSNVVKCRPPDNRAPDRAEWEACARYLRREVKAISPAYVLLLGNTALRAVVGRSGITKQRGKRLVLKPDHYLSDAQVMATVHPAYVLRNPGQTSVFYEDVKRFARMMGGGFKSVDVRVAMVQTVEGLKQLRRILMEAEVISYDVETRYMPWDKDWAIVCLGVSTEAGRSYVVPLYHPSSPFRRRWKDVLLYLKPAIQRPGVKLVAQNGKFDNVQLAGAGIFLEHQFDVMLAAHLLDENRPKNLGFLSQTVLGADEYKGMVETKPDRILKTDLRQLCRYNGYDTGYTYQLREKLRPELAEHPRLTRLFVKLMMPASHMMQQVEARGIWVDQERLWPRMEVVQKEIDRRKEVILDSVPKKFIASDAFLNSPQQLARWMFSSRKKGGLGLDPLIKTKSGNDSTNSEVMSHYIDVPEVQALLDYRTLELKWMRTYLVPWSTRIDSRGRIHTSYKLFGTVTGRLSGDMQQVPRDHFIRSILGAPPGWVFIQADYSQVELRIAAHVAQERRMIRAFLTGEDLHLVTATQMTGKAPEDIGKEERKQAKPVNFGFLYGMYPKKFVKYALENYQVKFTLEEAEEFRARYFETFRDLPAWHDRQRRIAHAKHQVQSPIGRVRHLPDILSSDNGVRMEAERQAINSPVQSMASDMMLFAMTLLHKRLDPNECFMVGTLHDGIFFECKEDKVEKWAPIIKEVMETLPLKKTFGAELSIPIVSEVEWDQHWSGIPDASGLGVGVIQ